MDLDRPGQAAGQTDSQDLESHQAGTEEAHQHRVPCQPGGEHHRTASAAVSLSGTGAGDSLVHVSPRVGQWSCQTHQSGHWNSTSRQVREFHSTPGWPAECPSQLWSCCGTGRHCGRCNLWKQKIKIKLQSQWKPKNPVISHLEMSFWKSPLMFELREAN